MLALARLTRLVSDVLLHRLVLLSLVAFALAACGDGSASGEAAETPGEGSGSAAVDGCLELRADGACLVAAPVGATDCPGAGFDHPLMDGALCAPLALEAAASCPNGTAGAYGESEWEGPCAPVAVAATNECPEGWTLGDPWELARRAPSWESGPSFGVCQPPEVEVGCSRYERPSLADEGACVPVGIACGERFASESAIDELAPGFEGARWFVDPESANDDGPPGDGSRGAPFATLGEATQTASSGDVIVLSQGQHAAELRLSAEVALVGACHSTELVPANDATFAMLTVDAEGARIANLSMTGDAGAIALARGASASVHEVYLRRAAGPVIDVGIDASLTLTRSALIEPRAGVGAMEPCVRVTSGARLEVDESLLAGCQGAGVEARGTSVSDVRRSVLRDIFPSSDHAHAIFAALGAEVRLEESVVQNAYQADLFALDDGSRIDARAVWFEEPRWDDEPGPAAISSVGVQGDATITLQDVVIDRPTGAGLAAINGGALEATRVVVANSRPGNEGLTGGLYAVSGGSPVLRDTLIVWTEERSGNFNVAGMTVGFGASLDAERVAIIDPVANAFLGEEPGGVAIRDLHVIETGLLLHDTGLEETTHIEFNDAQASRIERIRIDARASSGIAFFGGTEPIDVADLHYERPRSEAPDEVAALVSVTEDVAIERCRAVNGALAVYRGRTLASDAEVHGVSLQLDDDGDVFGVGTMVQGEGASLDLRRAAYFDNERNAIFVDQLGAIVLSDVAIHGALSAPPTEPTGRDFVSSALRLQFESTADVTRLRIEDQEAFGVYLIARSELVGRDVFLDGVYAGANGFEGVALTAAEDSVVDLERTVVRDFGSVAMVLAERSVASLRDVVISDGRGNRVNGQAGVGISVEGGTRAMAERVAIQSTRQSGLQTSSQGRLEASDIFIADVLTPFACENDGGCAVPIGHGAIAYDGSELRLERAAIVNCNDAGAVFVDGAQGSLRDVVIRETPIGIRDPSDGSVDIAGAEFRGTTVDFTTDALAVPPIESLLPEEAAASEEL